MHQLFFEQMVVPILLYPKKQSVIWKTGSLVMARCAPHKKFCIHWRNSKETFHVFWQCMEQFPFSLTGTWFCERRCGYRDWFIWKGNQRGAEMALWWWPGMRHTIIYLNFEVIVRTLKQCFMHFRNSWNDFHSFLLQAPDFVKDTVDTITDLSGNAINGVQSWFSDDDQVRGALDVLVLQSLHLMNDTDSNTDTHTHKR